MLIELIGYPGSGKTTFARSLSSGRNIPVVLMGPDRMTSNKLYLAILIVFRMPVFSLLLIFCLSTRKNKKLENYRRMLFLLRAYWQVKSVAHTKSEGTVVFDEGPIHALFSCLYGTAPTRTSNWLLVHLVAMIVSRIDLFIEMNVSKKESVQRFSGRDSESRFNRDTHSAVIASFLEDSTYEHILGLVDKSKIREPCQGRQIIDC